MPLSSELVSQFAKLASNKPKEEKESTVYGTTVIQNGNKYVKLDGSELLTPASFTTNIADGERVTVLIKNHMAIVTGNITSPAARTGDVEEVGDKADAVEAAVGGLVADNIKVNQKLEAQEGTIQNLTSDNVTIKNKLDAQEASIGDLEAENVTITGELEAAEGNIRNLEADNVTIKENLTAANASIKDLDTKKLSAEQADIKYANIDFSNIGKAAIENFYAESGIIEDLVVGDTSVTGRLVGVTITGDLIEGGTVKADKLVILGEDGLYYKLNVNALGETTASSDPKYKNGLDGSVIVAKSITAEKVNVHDLVAFDATIGGFKIRDSSIYSGEKESATNTTNGIYLDKNGQISFGDADNFIRYYKTSDGTYKLEISAANISIKSGGEGSNLNDEINSIKSNVDSLQTQVDQNNSSITFWAKEVYKVKEDSGKVREDCYSDTQKALENYVTDSDYTKSKAETDNKVSSIEDSLDNTASKDDLDGYVSNEKYNSEVSKYMQFTTDGIEIGSPDNSLKLTIDNSAIKFKNGDNVIGSWDGSNFYTGDIVIKLNQRAQFGNFAFVPRSDGSIMFLKVHD